MEESNRTWCTKGNQHFLAFVGTWKSQGRNKCQHQTRWQQLFEKRWRPTENCGGRSFQEPRWRLHCACRSWSGHWDTLLVHTALKETHVNDPSTITKVQTSGLVSDLSFWWAPASGSGPDWASEGTRRRASQLEKSTTNVRSFSVLQQQQPKAPQGEGRHLVRKCYF